MPRIVRVPEGDFVGAGVAVGAGVGVGETAGTTLTVGAGVIVMFAEGSKDDGSGIGVIVGVGDPEAGAAVDVPAGLTTRVTDFILVSVSKMTFAV